MENDTKKIDLLEKLFLLTAIIDIVVISNIGFFLVTLLTICIFLGIIMFVIESGALLYQAIKTTFTISVFTGIGFLRYSIVFYFNGNHIVYLFKKISKIISCNYK